MSGESAGVAGFTAELTAVQEALTGAAEELGMPLGELVRAQAKHAVPPLRAALVLTAAYVPEGDAKVRQQRIFLAAALEMLSIALHVHQLLVTAALEDQGGDLDKAFIGSTILAGDYCFSRAASMAAQTESPRVVTLFSQALQTVSEGHLRTLFGSDSAPFDENRALLLAGAEAALALAGSTTGESTGYRSLVLTLAERMAAPALDLDEFVRLLPSVPPDRQARWHALLHWLADVCATRSLLARSSH